MNSRMNQSEFPRVAYFNERRLFVVDDEIQPSDPEFMLVYSVHGHSMCLRKRTDDGPKLSFEIPPETLDFAIEQYRKWQSEHPNATAPDCNACQVTPLPPMRRKCPTCEGQGVWMDRVNKCSYGVTQEETNIVERCETCHGACYVEDFL